MVVGRMQWLMANRQRMQQNFNVHDALRLGVDGFAAPPQIVDLVDHAVRAGPLDAGVPGDSPGARRHA